MFRFLKLLLPHIRQYPWQVAFLLIGLCVEFGYETGLRYSFKILLDEALIGKNATLIYTVLATIGAGALFYLVVVLATEYVWARWGATVIAELRIRLFDHIQHMPPGFFLKYRTGDLLNRLTTDIELVDNGLVVALPLGIMATGSLAASSVLLISLEWRLFSASLFGMLLTLFITRAFSNRSAAAARDLLRAEGSASAFLQEKLTAPYLIKAYGLEPRVIAGFRTTMKDVILKGTRAHFLGYLIQRVPNVGFLFLHLGVLAGGVFLTLNNQMTFGALVSYQVLFLGLSTQVNHLTWVTPYLVNCAAGFERVEEILQLAEERASLDRGETMPPVNQGIDFREVSFSYSAETSVLESASFSVPRGSFTVLMGRSGSGKSTLIHLLLRFFEPQSGAILVDGIRLDSYSVKSVRARMALVSQEVILFNASVAENIRLGYPEASSAEIAAAARAAGIHDFITGLPQGYETLCDERGGRFSGGEKQRIALARALLRQPDILVLDEATSALDPQTEAEIIRTIEKLRGSCTIIAVAHRQMLADAADQVLFLEAGRIRHIDEDRHTAP